MQKGKKFSLWHPKFNIFSGNMPPDSPGFEHRIECHCPNFSSRVCTFKISLYTTECVIPVYPRLVTSIIKWFESKTGTNLWSMSLELIKLVTRMKRLPQNVVLNCLVGIFRKKTLTLTFRLGFPWIHSSFCFPCLTLHVQLISLCWLLPSQIINIKICYRTSVIFKW